ncbi:MAG: hypothetical protein AMXMBFR57_30570 [Acidimicrobiia bacterium]
MTFLVDANVLSEPTRPAPDPSVVAWLRAHATDVVIDPIVLGELRFGILLLPKGKKRQALEEWFDQGISRLHCLDWNDTTGLRWAALVASLRSRGQTMSVKDSLIAATALTHGLTVATRDVAGFRRAGVKTIDPWRG